MICEASDQTGVAARALHLPVSRSEALHLLVLGQRREEPANLLFSLTSDAIAVYAIIELQMLRAESPAEFSTALRWIHVPTWALTISLIGFVRVHLRVGRRWVAWTFCALWTLALILNFSVGQNLITSIMREVWAQPTKLKPLPPRLHAPLARETRVKSFIATNVHHGA